MKYFSKNIRFLRQQAGLSQADIERKLEIKRSTWNNYESGLSKPYVEALIVIAKFFDVAEGDLLHLNLSKETSGAKQHLTNKPGYSDAEELNATTVEDLRKTITAMEKVIASEERLKTELQQQLEVANKSIAEYKLRLQGTGRKSKPRK
jgi:transcriptional regulator with XRE-family HTH domain